MSKKTKTNLILLLICGVLVCAPIILHNTVWKDQGAEFGGADSIAEEALLEANPDYEPWAEVLWELPSGEVESLLFSLQAAIGAGTIGYCLGRLGKMKGENA